MKTKQSRKDWVISYLLSFGHITRNACLKSRITRLGAYVSELKSEGWKFEEGYYVGKRKKDYRYDLIKPSKEYRNYKAIK